MRIVAIEELRQNLASFLELSFGGEPYLAARKGRVNALVRPASGDDAFPPIGAGAFRSRAGRIVREASQSPRLITWYGRPAAAVVGAPEGWSDDEEDSEE